MFSSPKLILFATFAIIFAALTATLAGCGGSGGGTTQQTGSLPLQATPVNSQINLPNGTPINNVSSLNIWTSAQTTNPDPQGRANVTIFNNGPQFTSVRDQQNNLVLAAYLSDTQTTLDATSTAQTLVFVALGGLAQRDTGPETILAGVPNLAGFDTVVTEVENQLQTQGFISLQVGNLKSSIDTIVNAVTNRGRGTIAEPTNASGIALDTIVDGELKITQAYLRRTKAYLKRVGYVTEENEYVDFPGLEKELDLGSVTKYGGFTNTVANIVQGNLAWTPVTTGPYAIPVDPTSSIETHYELTVLGPGSNEGDTDKITDAQKSELTTLDVKTFFLDILFPTITGIILPLKGDQINEFTEYMDSDIILIDLINTTVNTAPQAISLLREGKFSEAGKFLWDSGFTSNSAVPALVNLAIGYMQSKGVKFDEFASEDVLDGLKGLGFVDVFFNSTEMAIFLTDISRSNRATIFKIRTTPGRITVVPKTPMTCIGEEVEIKAVIQNKNPNAVYKYKWTVPDGFRLESSSNGMDKDGILETSQDTVTLTATKFGKPVIKCEVTRVDGEPDRYVAKNEASVEFTHAPEYVPSQPEILAKETIAIRGSFSGSQDVLWKYTLKTPALGTINRTSVGSSPDVTFTSNGNEGSAELLAELYTTVNDEQILICSTELTIQIGDSALYTNVYSWYVDSYPRINNPNDIRWSGHVYAYKIVPRVPGAVQYELVLPENPSVIKAGWHVNSGPVEFGYQQRNNPNMDPYWVYRAGYFRADLESEQEAIDYCLQEGIPRLKREFDDESWKLKTSK